MDPVVATYPEFPWLTLLLVLPLIGSVLCWLHRHQPEECRWYALSVTLVVFALSVWLFIDAPQSGLRWFLYEDVAWIERFGIRYTLGLDGLSLLMVALTAFLQVNLSAPVLLILWHRIQCLAKQGIVGQGFLVGVDRVNKIQFVTVVHLQPGEQIFLVVDDVDF